MRKNLRKIPPHIVARFGTIESDEIVVGCGRKFRAEYIQAGFLQHMGIQITPERLVVPERIIPSASQGRFSARNVNGCEIIRKDLPKETVYHAIETPNWGDPLKGYHTVYLPGEKYPREFEPPRELEILMECSDSRPGLPVYIIVFKVDEILNKRSQGFEQSLFENLNLLQENVGACGVEPAGATLREYMKSLHVSWEILPPGSREEAIERIFRGRTTVARERDVANERYDFFMSLNPRHLIVGTSGFRRYFGALLEDDLVIFENIEYGNAVYILFENWEELSKKSRIELLTGEYGTSFKRVIHTLGWKGQVGVIVAEQRERKKSG